MSSPSIESTSSSSTDSSNQSDRKLSQRRHVSEHAPQPRAIVDRKFVQVRKTGTLGNVPRRKVFGVQNPSKPKGENKMSIQKSFIAIIFTLTAVMLFTGCLVFEKKEYRFKINDDGSGEGTIRYVNIVSSDDNGRDVSFKDYAELVTDYIEGTKYEDENPGLKISGKKLFEENGALVAELKFSFSTPDSAGFFRIPGQNCSTVMYFIKNSGGQETVTESNGKIITGVGDSPFIVWDSAVKEFTFKTSIQIDTTSSRSLVVMHRKMKGK
jgi:hypothetical protein